MGKKILFAMVCGVLVLFAASEAYARSGRRSRVRTVDRNKDGKISRREVKTQARVNTAKKARVDRNRDGIVQPKEAKQAKVAAKKGLTHMYLRNRSAVDRPWEKKADANNDGKLDGAELRQFHVQAMDANGNDKIEPRERWTYWTKHKAKVNTALEKKFDANSDGLIDWKEARNMFQAKLKIVSAQGRVVVDTDLELEFDVDGNGYINKEEAKTLREAIKAAEPKKQE